MNSIPELKIDWCSFEAAEYACRTWHYSHSIPAGKLMKVGAWETGKFIGAVIFARGANNNIGSPYGLAQTQICELVRVALTRHEAPVSRLVAIAMRFLKAANPGLRLIISYADPEQGHHGGIYQAGGWIYEGPTRPKKAVIVAGKPMHKRTASSRYGSLVGLEKTGLLWKHKYLMPLDDDMRRRIDPLSKPYPKRVKQANEGVRPECGGAAPTHTLQATGAGP